MSTSTDPPERPDVLFGGRIPLGDRTLRQHTARGTVINGTFIVGLSVLSFLRTFIVAGFLTPKDYGVFGLLVAIIATIAFLRDIGIGDKYIQQSEEDDQAAFNKAFTLSVLVDAVFFVLLAAIVPVVAHLIDHPELVAPGLVLLLAIPAATLTTPLWIFYRRMEFRKQRTLQAADPVVGFVVTVGLAVAGAGYWALIAGALAGMWATVAITLLASPYRLRWNFDRAALREYFSFSWPLFLVNANRLVLVQSAVFVGQLVLGLGAVGVLTLANQIGQISNKADTIVTGTIYPAICAVQERTELLFETFVKSNRLGLMWGMPFGIGLALFASDLVHFVLGSRWDTAIPLLQVFGLIVALGHLGYNWDAFLRARSDTRPIAIVGIASTVAYLGVAIPLLVVDGIEGYAIGAAAQMATALVVRSYYLTKLFDGFQMLKHAARAIAPSIPATAVVLLPRLFESGSRTFATAVAELAAYAVVTIGATAYLERDLIREIVGYQRTVQPGRAVPAGSS
jgi:O-antigen/teichoic acid export membrane protein